MKSRVRKIGIVAGWLAAWQALSLLMHNSIVLVGPAETGAALCALLPEGVFWSSLGTSFLQIVCGFLLGSFSGIALAFLAFRKRLFGEVVAPFVTALKTVPVASFIILALIWFGSSGLALFTSFIVVFPMLYLNTLEGLGSLDPKLMEMAQVYHIPAGSRLRCIYFPGIASYLRGSFELALGMSWKSGVAAEVIGQHLGTIGNGLYRAKINLDTAQLLAWTLVIILISYCFEKVFLALFDRLLPYRTGNS